MSAYAANTDKELLMALREGDQAAFTGLYEQFNKQIYFYVLGYVNDSMIAEDIVHDIFVKVWEMRERLQIHTSFEAYLFRIAHNMAINVLKKNAAENKLVSSDQYLRRVLAGSRIEDSASLIKYDRMLDDALDSLGPQCRRVFILCRQEGKSYKETAAELGISCNTVKEHLVKASKNLHAFLADRTEIALALAIILHLF